MNKYAAAIFGLVSRQYYDNLPSFTVKSEWHLILSRDWYWCFFLNDDSIVPKIDFCCSNILNYDETYFDLCRDTTRIFRILFKHNVALLVCHIRLYLYIMQHTCVFCSLIRNYAATKFGGSCVQYMLNINNHTVSINFRNYAASIFAIMIWWIYSIWAAPTGTWRSNNVIMTSKWRRNVVLTS